MKHIFIFTKGEIMQKKYHVINRFNGRVEVVYSKNRYTAMNKAKAMFGNIALELYSR